MSKAWALNLFWHFVICPKRSKYILGWEDEIFSFNIPPRVSLMRFGETQAEKKAMKETSVSMYFNQIEHYLVSDAFKKCLIMAFLFFERGKSCLTTSRDAKDPTVYSQAGIMKWITLSKMKINLWRTKARRYNCSLSTSSSLGYLSCIR